MAVRTIWCNFMQHGYLLPDYFYTSDSVFKNEIRQIFLSGSFACFWDSSDTSNKYSAFTHLNIPFILARRESGRCVFLNMCPHKRMALIESHGVNTEILRCPYHGWQFNDEGACVRAGYESLDTEGELIASQIRLAKFNTVDFGAWGFISQDTSFSSQFGRDVITGIRRVAASVDPIFQYISQTRTFNWKLYFDNLHDDSHVPFLHSNSLARSLDTSLKERVLQREAVKKFNDLKQMSYMAIDGSVNAQHDYYRHIQPLFPTPGYYNVVAWPNLHIASSDSGRTFLVEIHEPLSAKETKVHIFLFLRKNSWSTRKKQLFLDQLSVNTLTVLEEDFAACEKVQHAKELSLIPDTLSQIDNRNVSRNQFYADLMDKYLDR